MRICSHQFRPVYGALLCVFILFYGCGAQLRNTQMEKVAKDWCMVIRASQIIPVYPLTEDLQVGDAFLVQTTVDKQHEEYTKRGFLAMDNHFARIPTNAFSKFYNRSFHPPKEKKDDQDKIKRRLTLPKDWLSSGWESAPSASFPSYSFSVKSGAGLNMAIPVQGVPIGLSLMGSDAGDGTITISKAKTYGIDTESMVKAVRDWESDAHPLLVNYASTDKQTNYIRVISRVYLAKEMNVSLRTADSKGASGSAGAPKPVELVSVEAPEDDSQAKVKSATVKNYTDNLNTLNKYIENVLGTAPAKAGDLLPGGTVKFVASSSRSVSLKETFTRPMVVGYLAFDMRISELGFLGPPIPTHAVLEKKIAPSKYKTDKIQIIGAGRLALAYATIVRLEKEGDPQAKILMNNLNSIAKKLPDTYEVPIFVPKNGKVSEKTSHSEKLKTDPPNFLTLTTYYSRLINSKKVLTNTKDQKLKNQWFALTENAIQNIQGLLHKNDAIIKNLNDYTYKL